MGKASSRGSSFILSPVSGKANMKKNRSVDPLRSRTTPRIICDVMFDDFPVTLTDVSCLTSLLDIIFCSKISKSKLQKTQRKSFDLHASMS